VNRRTREGRGIRRGKYLLVVYEYVQVVHSIEPVSPV